MSTRLVHVVIDSVRPQESADWWARALGWEVTYSDPDEVDVEAPDRRGPTLVFVPVPEPKTTRNQIHLDLASATPADQDRIAARLQAAGARPVDIGQGEVPWVVMTDPEGNEFCVLEPREVYAHTGALAAVVVAAVDGDALARFWTQATGWRLEAPAGLPSLHPADGGPFLEFIPGALGAVKNRIHLDVAPYADDDHQADVERLLALGAARADVGQGSDVPWSVLLDPEGNEFCILSPR